MQPAAAPLPVDAQAKVEEHRPVAKTVDIAIKSAPVDGKQKSGEAVSAGDKIAAKVAATSEAAKAKAEAVVAPAQPSVANSGAGTTQAAVEMPELAKKNGCTACHKIDAKMVGPAWRDVAKKYRGVTEYAYSPKGSAAPDAQKHPLVEGMMMKVSKGGSGNWGGAAMIANDPTGKKQDQIKELVEFVLGLEK